MMTSLSDFAASERELLLSLPYKVGVFVSHADDVDGEHDDEKEMGALEACIKAIARLHEDKPLSAEIMRGCLSEKAQWPRWAAQSFNTPEAAREAAILLEARASESEFKNYRGALMEIATTVAQAYGEFDAFDEGESGGGFFGGLVSKIAGGFSALSADDVNHPMNVSAAEDGALAELRAALSS
ncbi:MAG: hypothetical protein R3E13_05145 [Alphaproteobacteria bacterium]